MLQSDSENGTGCVRYEYIPYEFNSIAFLIIDETFVIMSSNLNYLVRYYSMETENKRT